MKNTVEDIMSLIMNVIIYLRKSREDIEREKRTGEDTLFNHRLLLTGVADSRRYNYTLREEIESGDSIASRPVFQSVLKDDIPSGKYNAIMVTEISRLGRGDMEDAGKIIKALKQYNILIITPNKTYDIRNPADARQIRFELFLAREEFELTRERFRMGKEAAASKGKPPTGVSNILGYESYKGEIRTIQEHVPIIQKIFELRSEGISCDKISEEMNSLGYKTGMGTKFHPSTIKKIVKNRIYIGQFKFRKQWNRGIHAPIIDYDLWLCVQNVNNEATTDVPTRTESPYYMDIYCGICGNKMSGDSQNKRLYRCYNKKKAHNEYNFIYLDIAHQTVLNALKKACRQKKNLQKYIDAQNQVNCSEPNLDRINSLYRKLDDKKNFMEKCKADYESGDLPVKLYAEHYSKAEKEIELMDAELHKLKVKTESDMSNYIHYDKFSAMMEEDLKNWDNISNYNKRKIINILFPKITYDVRTEELILEGFFYMD